MLGNRDDERDDRLHERSGQEGRHGPGTPLQTVLDEALPRGTAGDSKEEGSSVPPAVNETDNSELDDEPVEPARVDENDIDDNNIRSAVEELDDEEDSDEDSFEDDIQEDGAGIDNDINDEENIDAAFEDDI